MVDSSFQKLLTRLVVRHELVRDNAIQEGIDLVHNGSVGAPKAMSMVQGVDTHRICPLGVCLSFKPVNKSIIQLGHIVTRTNACVILAHFKS